MDNILREDGVIYEGTAEGCVYAWVHRRRNALTERSLLADETFTEQVAWALLEPDTQPRAFQSAGTVVLILRAINQGKGKEPEDMVSLRLAIRPERIVSVEVRRLPVIDGLIAEFRSDEAPETVNDFVIHVIETLRMEVEPVLDALEAEIGALEIRSAGAGGFLSAQARAQLADLRQDAILLLRFLAPQAQALERLGALAPAWLTDPGTLQEEAEGFRRMVSDLESVRERGKIVAEELATASNERLNRTMVTLSMVSVVFLPLTFLTGLFGVNLEGIPFAESDWSFDVFALLMLLVGALGALIAARLLR